MCFEVNLVKDYILKRVIDISDYMIKTGCTVRKAGEKFKISKSTVHKDITERLKYINQNDYLKIRDLLDVNKKERHIRGGNATKNKYLMKKAIKNN